MTIEIKHKRTGEVLLKVEANTLVGADLSGVNLSEAGLKNADLRGAKEAFIFDWGTKLKVGGDKK